MAQFKIGDVVQLKSGGPRMTVAEIYGDGDLGCVWFVGTKQEAGTFPPEALQFPEKPQAQSQIRPFNPGGEY